MRRPSSKSARRPPVPTGSRARLTAEELLDAVSRAGFSLLAELEQRILDRYPHGDEIDTEAMERFRNENLHGSLRNWRRMYGYAWANGVFGQRRSGLG
jgi:hypothetical protein